MELHKLLREQRIKKGYSQKALAEITHVTQPHINDLEHGKRLPSLSLLEKLGDALDIEIIIRPKNGC